jgi:hypothetical protein
MAYTLGRACRQQESQTHFSIVRGDAVIIISCPRP